MKQDKKVVYVDLIVSFVFMTIPCCMTIFRLLYVVTGIGDAEGPP